jgi:hypothetical protein
MHGSTSGGSRQDARAVRCCDAIERVAESVDTVLQPRLQFGRVVGPVLEAPFEELERDAYALARAEPVVDDASIDTTAIPRALRNLLTRYTHQ